MNMNKSELYSELLRDVESLIKGVDDNPVGVLANAAALIYERTGFFWVGFYMVGDGVLKLGPFQGPAACYRIGFGRGVCGTAWERRSTVVVPDVEEFPGHIACSSLSRSEIVVPLFDAAHEVTGVLDIDSREIATFDDTDREWLERICGIISEVLAASPYRA